MQNGVLPLNEKTLAALRQKHPDASAPSPDVLLPDAAETVHPIKY
mgnify:CR=1 FL=1